MIKMVVFDMAGTVINENNLVYKCLTEVLNNNGVHVGLIQVLKDAAGKEKKNAIQDMVNIYNPDFISKELVDKIYNEFSAKLENYYNSSNLEVFPEFPEVLEFLQKHKIKVVLNTGYSEHIANLILERVKIIEGKDIDLLVSADSVSKGRPEPDMILYACKQFAIDPTETIKVGDSQVDILEGKNAAVLLSIGITTGAQAEEQLREVIPDFVIHKLNQLIPLIQENMI